MSDKILIRNLTFGGVNYGDVVSYKDYNQSQSDLEQANKDIQVLAEAIHYPDCWDTMAYPTLLSAIIEMNHCTTCANKHLKEGG